MNRILKKISLIGLLSTFLISPFAQAEIKEVLAEANGLYCETCTYAVLRQLRVLPGIDKVYLLLEDGAFQITLEEGHPFQPEEIIRVIGKSSYNYTGMKILATGTIGSQGRGMSLSVPENKTTFQLMEGDETTLKAKKVLDGSHGQTVTVIGSYKKNESDPSLPILNIESATAGKTSSTSILD